MMTANSARTQLWMAVRLYSLRSCFVRLCFLTIITTLLLSSATLVSCSRNSSRSVAYDHRALLIDGERRFLISGSIHYPRSTPQMWPKLLNLAKEGGLDVIETYVFWNGHEPVRGEYNFQDRYDILGFIREVQKANLLMTLRIGPFICAEWDFGGFPDWLLEIPGIQLRTDNEPFKAEMERIVRKFVTMMQENGMFYPEGGPIILAQIENEYRHVARSYGEAGTRYSEWAANMALSLNIGVPWIMCQQSEAPEGIIVTCNGFYCDKFQPIAYNQPKLWTELYPGWAHHWGGALVSRPVEDSAFAAALFFQKGGSFVNYYMYHGGTNFGRTAAAGITTSYDFFAPIDEYGEVRQPDWTHFAQLHEAIKLCAPAMAAVDEGPSQWSPGRYLEISVYNSSTNISSSSSSLCAAFLANRDLMQDAIMEFQGQFYHVPARSVSILPDCKKVLFNTATVTTQTPTKKMVPFTPGRRPKSATTRRIHTDHNANRRYKPELVQQETNYDIVEDDEGNGIGGFQWEWFHEPFGISSDEKDTIVANTPLEQFSVTVDSTDYLWYSTKFNISNNQTSPLLLNLGKADNLFHVFINGNKVSQDHSPPSLTSRDSQPELELSPIQGTNSIDLLSVTMGHPSSGPWLEKKTGGIKGSISIGGLSSNNQLEDLTHFQWKHQVGLKGEQLHLELEDQAENYGKPLWTSSGKPPINEPLVWYKTTVDYTGPVDGPVVLDLGSMKKGVAWMNGHQLGRYWASQTNPSTAECSTGCDYRVNYRGPASGRCRIDCGQPSQRWYHVPREWLKPSGNRLVLFEEIGGDPHGVSLSRPVVHSVCAHVSSDNCQVSQEPQNSQQMEGTGLNCTSHEEGQLNLDCGFGSHIGAIKFASLGNPMGTCGNFTVGSCHASRSETVVKNACIGRQNCQLTVRTKEFLDGEDLCANEPKMKLAVEALCIQA
ncbi:unnamed protein product [Calypogeia fissa]